MNKVSFILVVLCTCLSLKTMAQEEKWTRDPTYSDGIRHREIMMNMTPLVSQFVPFNASTVSKLNLFDFQTRKLKNGRGTHLGLGLNIESGLNSFESPNFYFRWGIVRRRQIASHFHFARSWNVNVIAEDFNSVNASNRKLNFSGLGFSYSAGFEYSINSRLTISTEGSLFLGLLNAQTGAPLLKFLPPVGLYFHVKL